MTTISEGLAITDSNFDLLLDLTYECGYDSMKDLEFSDPAKLDKVLTAHFVTKFLTDVLQFCTAFYVKVKGAGDKKEEKPTREVYDHRKKIEAGLDFKDAHCDLEFVVGHFEKVI